MRVSYQWLSQYIDLSGISAQQLAEMLTRSGIEVDVVENRNKGVEQIVVGYVKSREQHPNADKLSVCTVDVGQANDLQIVCGASNVDADQKVAVAVVGATLPGDFRIKKAKLRGLESMGMICSAKELGLNDKLLSKEIQEGILVLPPDVEIGSNVLDLLGIEDHVLELDLTPNRSDCLSMIGVAYEVAAIIEREVLLPDPLEAINEVASKASEHVSVSISAAEQCRHYAARFIQEVRIGASPLWMQNRLMASGIRPINNIVDITNYVMLEYGQPLHAFDADRLSDGRIDVRLAHAGEKLVTLDGIERALEPHMLLITDGRHPVALAGVMGGAHSEVTASTSRILLESANFTGGSVRRTSRQLGLRSEASLRFEKGANPDTVLPALNRAASLIAQYAGGQVAEGVVQAFGQQTVSIAVDLSLDKVNSYLGTELSLPEIKAIFTRLNFDYVEGEKQSLIVNVPSRRSDIVRDVDLIEEIARLYGYDNIPTTLMNGVTTPGSFTKEQTIRRTIRRLLTSSGLQEVIHYSLTHAQSIRHYPGLPPSAKPVVLSMPMSEDRSTLRMSLIPSLLEVAVYNRRRNYDDVAIFELGSVFVTEEERLTKLPQEKLLLSMLWTGHKQSIHWSKKAEKVDFFDLKGVFEQLVRYLGIANVEYTPAQTAGFHPGRTAEISIQAANKREVIGWIGQLHPEIQQTEDLDDTYILEVDVDALYEHVNFAIQFQTLPRYPAIGRDIAIIVQRQVAVVSITDKVKAMAGSLLESIQVFDIFTSEQLGLDKKSVAFSLVYRHPERTLTDEEVSVLHAEVVQALEQSFDAVLRK